MYCYSVDNHCFTWMGCIILALEDANWMYNSKQLKERRQNQQGQMWKKRLELHDLIERKQVGWMDVVWEEN